MTTREDVVREALRWERTPYRARARLLGVGVDCAMFPAEVYHAVGLVPRLDPVYSEQWMMNRDEEQFLSWVRPHAREIPRHEVGPGDFGIWRFGRCYSHGAIVIDAPLVIHAVVSAGAVVRADMDRDSDLADRPSLFFTLF